MNGQITMTSNKSYKKLTLKQTIGHLTILDKQIN